VTRRRAVVVLSGGGAKGAAHLGAARALQEQGVDVVRWIGTSMGAVIATALASGTAPEVLVERFLAVKRRDVLATDRVALLRGIWAKALLKPEPFRRAISEFLPVHEFSMLQTPCTITAVDVQRGNEVAFGTDGIDAPLVDAVVASCALPPWFPPAMVAGRAYYDGGLHAVVPLHLAAGIACDMVIVIHTGPGFDEQGEVVAVPPPFVAATDTAIGWLMARNTHLSRQLWPVTPGTPPLLWIRPISDRGATFAMERIPQYAEKGYRETLRALLQHAEQE
jgi:NTE family protein